MRGGAEVRVIAVRRKWIAWFMIGAALVPAAYGSANEAAETPEFKPRFELRVPSLKHLYQDAMRSRSAPVVESVRRMVVVAGQSSAEGVNPETLARFLSVFSDAPDAALDVATFAPDLEGRARWVAAVDWPLADLHKRIEAMLALDAAESVLAGVTIEPHLDDGYVIKTAGEPLAYLFAAGEKHATIASHPDVTIHSSSRAKTPENGRSDNGPLLSARLNLTRTERDSGATFFSSFTAVTAINYEVSVNEDGNWDETVRVSWPPISGIGAKAILGRVDQTFFVPEGALGAVVLSTPVLVTMLDGMAGLGPQVVMDAPGQVQVIGEPMPGPIATHVEAEVCLTVLPGTGFLPAPDLLIQVRTKHVDALTEALHEETGRINALFAERDQPEPWSEVTVRDRSVFWSEPPSAPRGVMMPFVMRPVLFTTSETDAKDRDRSFLVLGMTTTDPAGFVERWLAHPRTRSFRHLPTERKSNGQLWVQWRKVYALVSPYLNFAIAGAGIDALLPPIETMNERLTEGVVTAKVRYSGLTATHSGPLPIGVFVVPSLLGSSIAPDESGSSDLARERLATRRLKLLYHHCKLFKKDIGRWPAEIGELDGYVDFAGHPELLELRLSAQKNWSDFFSGLTKAAEKDDEPEDEQAVASVKTDLYVINWSPDQWSLGYKKDAFEHLEELYIDQFGEIHRSVRSTPRDADTTNAEPETGGDAKEAVEIDQADDGPEDEKE